MQKYLCKIGLHKYVSLNMTDCFTTNYTDQKWTIKHVVWYQQCSCCGKRRLKDRYKKEVVFYDTPHAGIEYARVGWETYGRMYLGKGQEVTLPPTAPKPSKSKLKVIDGGKNG
jgi:hypothetical protein